MIRKLYPLLITLVLLGVTIAFAKSSPKDIKEGTYIGYQHWGEAKAKIPTTIENIFLTAYQTSKTALITLMNLSFGGFHSSEYITQNYYVPDISVGDDAFSLLGSRKGNGPDITVFESSVLDGGKKITGKLSSRKSGRLDGRIELVYYEGEETLAKLNTLFPEVTEIMKPITGDYKGSCYSPVILQTITYLQIEAVKVGHSWEESNAALTEYRVIGRAGRDPHRFELELDKNEGRKVEHTFEDGSYNFYTRSLEIASLGLRCRVSNEKIDCGKDGKFERIEETENSVDHFLTQKDYRIPENKVDLGIKARSNFSLPVDEKKLEGKYEGLLHMEGRDVYESISAEIFYDRDNPGVSMTGKIYIAGEDKPEQNLAFSYVPTRFPEKELTTLALFGDEEHRESFLKIHHWNERGMRGILYSRTYGRRVGEFMLLFEPTREELVELSERKLLAPSLEANYYNGKKFDNGLQDGLGIMVTLSAPPREQEKAHEIPHYFPFKVGGVSLDYVVIDAPKQRSSIVSDEWVGSMFPDMKRDLAIVRRLREDSPHYRQVGDQGMFMFPSGAKRGAYDPFTGNLVLELAGKGAFIGKLLPNGNLKGFVRGGEKPGTNLRLPELLEFERLPEQ